MRPIRRIMAAVAVLACMQGTAAAQGNGPTMTVVAGLDGYCRQDIWCPIYVVLSNGGEDVEGQLHVWDRSSLHGDNDLYARPVLLPSQSRKAFSIYIPSPGLSGRWEVQLVADGETLASQTVVVRRVGEEDRFYGAVGSNPSALNFLNDIAPAGGEAVVAHLSLEALPPNPLGWEGLDVLVLNDVDTTGLSPQQRQALETWVVHGGHLIVGGGAGAARTAAGIADLLPVAVVGTQAVDSLWALGERWDVPVATGPFALAETTLQEGETLIEQDGLILLARRTYGAGAVDFVAFDAGLNPFTNWKDHARLWEYIAGTGTTGLWRQTVGNEHSAHDAINAIPGLELPSTLQILAFMLLYTLLVGPVNYLVLRKLDRRELAWVTIPVLIAGFTACAYLTGFQIRGGKPIVHSLALVHVPDGADTGRASELVGLFSPRRTTYDVHLPQAQAGPVPGSIFAGPAPQPLHVIQEADGSTISDLRVNVGGVRPFVADGYVDVPAVETDLQLAMPTGSGSPRLEGVLRNGSARLEGAVIIAGGNVQRLGDLEPGAEVAINLCLDSSWTTGGTTGPYLHTGSEVASLVMGTTSFWDDQDTYRRYQLLQTFFPYEGPGLAGVHLAGWVETAPLPIVVEGRPSQAMEIALYIYDLPVGGLETGRTVTVPPGLIQRSVASTAGPVDMWPGGLYMGPGATVVLRFTIWPGATVRVVDELTVNLQGESTSLPPTVLLWNREEEGWEEVDVGWGQHSIPNSEAYVVPPGVVLLRLETDAAHTVNLESPTITIRGQR